ncbi:MAG: nucleotidyl transferase AbiEii/AbiGii toxin family protein [Eggerthellaceae bacterium]|nr:nucleotidyl transferase AbiEii/AbiGii toxin family protein [Eggerthellaceae bacterium]
MVAKRPNSKRNLDMALRRIGDADEPDYLVPADANRVLAQIGFPDLGPIPTMPLHHQIAQKLHGASEPGSERAHDLIDLQVIVSRGEVDYALTRQTCERLFAYRRKQAWPPTIVKGEEWDRLYADQLLPEPVLQTADEAVAWANELIGKIARA